MGVRIGVYVMTDQVMKRETKKREKYFDGMNFIGLRYILSELGDHEISYVSKDTVDTVDYALVSLTSYYDVLNILNELHGKRLRRAKVIVGGAGCNNVGLLSSVADYAIVGRGEGIVPTIIGGDVPGGVWSKQNDPDVSGPVDILPAKKLITMPDEQLGVYEEKSVGCTRRCCFCEYGWKHRFYAGDAGRYTSGFNLETMFRDIDFSAYRNHDIVAALDGMTEASREIVGKRLSNSEITEKLLEIYAEGVRDYVSLKLYNLLGYPWETRFEPDELIEAVSAARVEGSSKRANILVVSPHFMPMPFTPMECEPVNWHDFRQEIKDYSDERLGSGNIRLFWNWSLASSPLRAAEATVLNRAGADDALAVKSILCSSKYRSMNQLQKRVVLEKHFGQLLGRVDSVLPYIRRQNDTTKAKRMYEERKRRLAGGQ